MKQDLIKLAEAIKDIEFTMFSTIGLDGNIFSRPMASLKIDAPNFDGKIWFFTDINSLKVFSIANDQHVNLAYASSGGKKFISVSGRARTSSDKGKMKELWTPAMKAWFPEGINDPNISLICVEVETAELWDSPPSKLIQLVGLAKAMATGKRIESEKYQQHIDVRGQH